MSSPQVPEIWRRRGVLIAVLLVAALGGCRQQPRARTTPQMQVPEKFWLRVRLLGDVSTCEIEASAPFNITSPDHRTDFHYRRNSGSLHISAASDGFRLGPADGLRRVISTDRITIQPQEPFIFSLNGRQYRGSLRLLLDKKNRTFDALNLVPLEPYLAGVIGAEMPDYWEPEALKAQAIAARTYALYIKKQFGPARDWDLVSTQANQRYLGLAAESPRVWRAVEKTAGRVLTCRPPTDTANTDTANPYTGNTQWQIFPAYYSSTCGGYTENSENVFGDSFEPLRPVPCPYCKHVARINLFFWPIVRIDKDTVSRRLLERYDSLKKLGKVTQIQVAKSSEYDNFSRVTSVKLTGPGGSEYLRGEDFRLTLDPTGRKIRSTIFELCDFGDTWAFAAGRGYGHGVGLCQCGAQGMARAGRNAEQILQHYYPGSKIAYLY